MVKRLWLLIVFGALLIGKPSWGITSTLPADYNTTWAAAVNVLQSMTMDVLDEVNKAQGRIVTKWTLTSEGPMPGQTDLSSEWIQTMRATVTIRPAGKNTKANIVVERRREKLNIAKLPPLFTGSGKVILPINAPAGHWAQLFTERLAWELNVPQPLVGW